MKNDSKKKITIWERIYYFFKDIVNRISYSQELFSGDIWKIRFSNKPHQQFTYKNKQSLFAIKSADDLYKYLLFFVMAGMLLAMLIMCHNIGISTREMEQHHYTELVYNHLHHIGDDKEFQEHPFASTQAQYIDLIVYSVAKALHINDIYLIRHYISTIFGWLLILHLSFLILKAYSWRAAFFTAFFLFISPRFIGYSGSNLVDVTFAFGFVFTISQIYYFCRELPTVRIYRIAKIILGTLITLSTYNAGFVLMHFFFIFTILNFIIYNPIKKIFTKAYWFSLLKFLSLTWCITALIYLLHGLFTLFLIKSWVAPSDAFALLANNYPIANNQLFSGHVIGPDNHPTRYLLQYLFITIPIVVIIGFILFFIFFKSALKAHKIFSLFLFLYAFFFCLHQVSGSYMNPDTMWAIYYTIYPLFILIAVSGVECALLTIHDKYANFVVICILGLLSFMPIRHIAFNEPVFIYFNGLAGGITNGYTKYEIDYNSQSNKLACHWMRNYLYKHEIGQHATPEPIIVSTDGNAACDLFFAGDTNIILRHEPYLKSDTTWDYYISFCKDIPAAQLRNGTWPSDQTLYCLKLENKPIVAFYENHYRTQQRAIRDSLAAVALDSLENIALDSLENIE